MSAIGRERNGRFGEESGRLRAAWLDENCPKPRPLIKVIGSVAPAERQPIWGDPQVLENSPDSFRPLFGQSISLLFAVKLVCARANAVTSARSGHSANDKLTQH